MHQWLSTAIYFHSLYHYCFLQTSHMPAILHPSIHSFPLASHPGSPMKKILAVTLKPGAISASDDVLRAGVGFSSKFHFRACFLGYSWYKLSQILWEMHSDIYMQEVCWEVFLGTTHVRGSRPGQRKKLNKEAVATENSGQTLGNSHAGWRFKDVRIG